MTLQWLTQWWNLIFVAPFVLALLYLALYTMTGVSFGEAEGDADLSADADMDADADLDADADVDADADLDTDADVDADADAGTGGHGIGHVYSDAGAAGHVEAHGGSQSGSHQHPSTELAFHVAALRWLGVGRAPLSIVLMVLVMSWSLVGFIANGIFAPNFEKGVTPALYSIPIAAVAAVLITRGFSMLMGRYVPLDETYARRKHELLGCVGEALFAVSDTEGVAVLHDDQGDLFQVACRTRKDEPAIAKSSKVKLVAYNARQGVFYVKPERAGADAKGTMKVEA